jgi:hypothetical protein
MQSTCYSLLAPRIRELGEPCRAAIVRVQALGLRNNAGEDMYGLLLEPLDGTGATHPVWVGDAVPAAALKLLRSGAVLPARRLPDGDDRDLAIDWEQAQMQPITQHHTNQ